MVSPKGVSLEIEEHKVLGQVHLAFKEELEMFESLLLLMNHGCVMLGGRDHDRGLNFLHLFIAARSFVTLHRARADLVLGYPVPCLTLVRSAFEDWGTMRYTARHPESVRVYLQGILPEFPLTDEREPNFRVIWEEIKREADEANAPADDTAVQMYGVLSEFAHPRSMAFSWSVDSSEGTWRFLSGPYYDHGKVQACFSYLLAISVLLVGCIDEMAARVRVPGLLEWRAGAREPIQHAADILRRHSATLRGEGGAPAATPEG